MTTPSIFAQALKAQAEAPRPHTEAKITITRPEVPEEKKYPSAVIVIRNGQVFVPSEACDTNLLHYYIDPVFCSAFKRGEVVKSVEKKLIQEDVQISKEDARALLKAKGKKDPLLKATGSSSWLNLRKTALFYSIGKGDEWTVFLHNQKKPALNSYDLMKTFPLSTSIEEMVKVIMTDAKKYPYAFEAEPKRR